MVTSERELTSPANTHPQMQQEPSTSVKSSVVRCVTPSMRRRFGIEDDSFKKLLTLTLRQVSNGDSGVYRCEFCFNGEQVPLKTITFWGESNMDI